MKIREVVLIVLGTIATLIFVGFMFDYYLRVEETQLIRRNMHFDSLVIQEQMHLKKKDSALDKAIKNNDARYNSVIQYHDAQIKKIKEELEKIKE